jgi:hypothetical protein
MNQLTRVIGAALFVCVVNYTAVAAEKPATPNLDWIAGYWCLEDQGERTEEFWLPARGGLLIGVSRTTRGERAVSFEFMRIAIESGVPTYIAQPNGKPPVSFKWTAGGSDWARFENPAHDFPRRVEYRRMGERLHAEVAGPGKEGRETVIPYEYTRCSQGT